MEKSLEPLYSLVLFVRYRRKNLQLILEAYYDTSNQTELLHTLIQHQETQRDLPAVSSRTGISLYVKNSINVGIMKLWLKPLKTWEV